MPILSICIPTYNRAGILDKTLKSIVKENIFLETDLVEIVISDNCSTDNTPDVVKKYLSKFPEKIKYVRQEENIRDKNFATVLSYASGTFAKLHNDTLLLRKNALSKMVEALKENQDKSVVFFLNSDDLSELSLEYFSDAEAFLQKLSQSMTWIGGLCVNSELYKTIEEPARFSKLNFSQVDIIARMLAKSSSSLIVNNKLFDVQFVNKKGGYNVAEVFGHNLLTILYSLKQEGKISETTLKKIKKDTLKKVINFYYFDVKKQCNFTKSGYFKFLFKYYKNCPYFYLNYLKYQLLRLRYFICRKQCLQNKRIITFLGIIKIRTKINLRKRWRARNKHNFTTLSFCYDMNRIVVGNNSYGHIKAAMYSPTNEKLYIGNYCSIGGNVEFIVASEHDYKNISTYPFKVMLGGEAVESLSKGDIVVEDDVWIGNHAMILSGVTIGQGAVVAAGSVVTKDVEPYSIVAGNPAKFIKYRFEPEIIERLKNFDYSKLTTEKALSVLPQLYTNLTVENVDRILKEVES